MRNNRKLAFFTAAFLLASATPAFGAKTGNDDSLNNKRPLLVRIVDRYKDPALFRSLPSNTLFQSSLGSKPRSNRTAQSGNNPSQTSLTSGCMFDEKSGEVIMPDGSRVKPSNLGIKGTVVDYRAGKEHLLLLTTECLAFLTYCGEAGKPVGTSSRSVQLEWDKKDEGLLKTGRVLSDNEVIGIFSNGKIARIVHDGMTSSSHWYATDLYKEEIAREKNPLLFVFNSDKSLVLLPSQKKGVWAYLSASGTDTKAKVFDFKLDKPFDEKTTVVKTSDGFEIKFKDGTTQKLAVPKGW